jgi:prevent-host-death family protein
MSTWQMPDAQARLAEVIDKALHEGPQTITDNGVDVIVLAESEYRLLANRKPTFIEFFAQWSQSGRFHDRARSEHRPGIRVRGRR